MTALQRDPFSHTDTPAYGSNSQIPQCTCPIYRNSPFRTECTHLCSGCCFVGYGTGALRDYRFGLIGRYVVSMDQSHSPTMHLSHILQRTIQNIYFLNGALWDLGTCALGVYQFALLWDMMCLYWVQNLTYALPLPLLSCINIWVTKISKFEYCCKLHRVITGPRYTEAEDLHIQIQIPDYKHIRAYFLSEWVQGN